MESVRKSLMIFRRDLRLVDNTALIACLAESESVLPCFIITPEQTGNSNKYKSDNCIQFMFESLVDLDTEIHKQSESSLHIFVGKLTDQLKRIYGKYKFNAVYVNMDYTPYSIARDKKIATWCKSHEITFHSYEDSLLHPVGDVAKKDGKPYKKFTPFYNTARELAVKEPSKINARMLRKFCSVPCDQLPAIPINDQLFVRGGRKNGLVLLRSSLDDYAESHNIPSQSTTNLSAYNKFGCLSIREVYTRHAKNEALIRQLYWRDFYYYIAWHNPRVLGKNTSKSTRNFREGWQKRARNKHWSAWTTGTTGVPIVDAGMRQLNTTGFMHGRVRQIVASFLVHNLQMDWSDGEQYFATKLVDYDPSQNNGNWQWVAGTGVDIPQYGPRVYNPWLQAKKYDPEAIYIKQYVVELADVPIGEILNRDTVFI